MSADALPPITRELTEWAAALDHGDIPDPVVHHARRALLDVLGSIAIGATGESARIVREYQAALDGGRADATVIGTSLRLSPPGAALANGVASHIFETDDGYRRGSFHPGGPIISAVLAAGEDAGSDGKDLLRAIVVGYEIGTRIGGATHPATWRRGFYNTSLVGVFGATAGVGAVLGLDAERLATALGLAGAHAGGMSTFMKGGIGAKHYGSGLAARDGVVSAELAARGLSAPQTIIEGPDGFVESFAGGSVDLAHALDDLGESWRMLGTYFKPYACARHMHGPIEATRALVREEGVRAADVEQVRVETYSVAATFAEKPHGPDPAVHLSIPYAVAVVLTEGDVTMDTFEGPLRHDADVLALADRVEVVETDECNADYPASRPVIVRVAAGGAEHQRRVDHPLGEPENPIGDDDLVAKFHDLASRTLDEPSRAAVVDGAWGSASPATLARSLAIGG